MATMRVLVRCSFEGVHSWPGCPLEEVAFLRTPHRHVFHVEATRSVGHDDRQIEIIMFKHELRRYCETRFAGPHHMSCEMMARDLLDMFALDRCTVTEDGENGAEVTR